MGWFWADTSSLSPPLPTQSGCPIPRRGSSRATVPKTNNDLNPLNLIPVSLSSSMSESQSSPLPLSRQTSSIPKADGSGYWEYPSPQQMYNAMLRKGHTDTDVSAVESMVAVHNFLNEGAWADICEWERRAGRGWAGFWGGSERGGGRGWDDNDESSTMRTDVAATASAPRLVRFEGRPNDATPKSRVLHLLGTIYPSRFSSKPPFDRHDWYVERHLPHGRSTVVRYVIDYYEGNADVNGDPVFHLDVRPAVDGLGLAAERLLTWAGRTWSKTGVDPSI